MKQRKHIPEADASVAIKPRRVVMVVYPDAHVLDVAGPLEVLTGASLFLPNSNTPYETCLVAHQAGAFRTTSGLTLQADQEFGKARRSRKPIETLIIAGGHGTVAALEDESLMDYVRWAADHAQRVVSICTGAMILAELGLLDGRRATTHWWWCPVLSQRYPKVTIDPDALYVQDGKFWTSAGVTAGMDLALALVEADWGHEIALQVARYNVMYMMRPGGQSQFSAKLIAQQSDDPVLASVLKYIQENIGKDLNVTVLSQHGCLTERTLTRKFQAETGLTPARYVELVRIDAARIALEQSSASVESIARSTGFINSERMRRAFQRHLGISASEYRERFRLTFQSGTSNADTEP